MGKDNARKKGYLVETRILMDFWTSGKAVSPHGPVSHTGRKATGARARQCAGARGDSSRDGHEMALGIWQRELLPPLRLELLRESPGEREENRPSPADLPLPRVSGER